MALSSLHYFESKEVLIEKALEHAISGSFEDMEGIWKDARQDYKTALRNILSYLLEGAIRFSGITRAGLQYFHMHQTLLSQANRILMDCFFRDQLKVPVIYLYGFSKCPFE